MSESEADVARLGRFERPIHALVQGASRGIGLALARLLLEHPGVARVHATCRHPDDAPSLVALADEHRGRLRRHALDVTDESAIAAAASAVCETGEPLDLLVSCAGVLHEGTSMTPERRLADVDGEAVMRSFAVNALGPLLVAKHFARLFPRDRHAVLATLSARVGSIGDNRLGGWYAYRCAKAAQNMVTRNLSIELRRRARGLVCVALHPGTVDTDLSRPFQRNVPAAKLFDTARAARQLLGVIGTLASADNGRFIAWDGEDIPW